MRATNSTAIVLLILLLIITINRSFSIFYWLNKKVRKCLNAFITAFPVSLHQKGQMVEDFHLPQIYIKKTTECLCPIAFVVE